MRVTAVQFVSLAVWCLAGSGAASAQGSSAARKESLPRYDLSTVEIATVQQGVRKALAEPLGATVEEVRAGLHPSNIKGGEPLISVCGYVQALNRRGVMSGKIPFIGILLVHHGLDIAPSFRVAEFGDSLKSRGIVVQLCREQGLLD